MPTSLTPDARTAAPQPPSTSTNVPMNSADSRWAIVCSGMASGFPGSSLFLLTQIRRTWWSEQVHLAGHRERFAATADGELGVEAGDVRLHGVLADEERGRDVGVRRAAGQLVEHLV